MSDSPGKIVGVSCGGGLACRLTRVAVLIGIVAALVGAGHLSAWLGGYLTQRGLSTITMKTNAALCLTLVGIGLMLLVPPKAGPVRRWAARTCAVLALVVGLLTFVENLSGWDFGIDQVLAVETPGALAVAGPNRMGTPASLSFTLTGLALLILSRRKSRGVRAAQALALAVCVIGLLATVGFLYSAERLYGIAQYTGIAWPTAIMLLLVGLGLLCARPAEGLMAHVTANDPGGVSFRRLLPAFVILPLLLGYLRLAGERAGVFDAPMGTGIMILLFIIIFSALTYHASRGANRSAQTLRESEERFRVAQELSLDAFTILTAVRDGSGRIVDFRWQYVNPAAGRILCHAPAELVGRRLLEVLPGNQTNSDLFDRYVRVVETGRPHDYELAYDSEGIRGWLRNMTVKLGDGIAVYFADITARKQTEEALRASEERFRRYFELGLVGMAISSPTKGLIEVNDTFCRMLGYERDELLRTTWAELTHPDDLAPDVAQWDRVMAGEIADYTIDKRFIRKDGQVVDASISVTVVRGADGSVDSFMALVQDVTESKRAEEVLRVKDNAISSSLNAMAMADLQGLLTYVNPAFLKLWEYEDEHEVLGKSVLSFWEEPERANEVVQAILKGGSWAGELIAVKKDGSHLSLYLSANSVFNDEGTPVCMMASFMDVTERKKAEEDLRRSEERYHRLFVDDLTGDFISTPQGRILLCNPAFAEMFGFPSPQDAVGTSILDLYPDPQERETLLANLKREGKIGRLGVWRRRRDGEPIHIVENLVGHFNEQGELYDVKGYLFEDTERKRAEEALRESEERFRVLADGSPLIIWVTDAAGRMQFVNRAYCEFFGTTLEELQSGGWQPLIHPDDAPMYTEPYFECLREHKPFHAQTRVRRYDGRWRWIESYGQPRFSASGEFLGIVGSSPDITERKQGEEALRKSEERLLALVTASSEVLYRMSPDWSEMRRLDSRGFLANTEKPNPTWLEEYIPPDDQPQVRAVIQEAIRTKSVFELEHRVRRADGSLGWTFSRAVPLLDANGEIVEWFGSADDITQQKQAQETLRQWNEALENQVAQRTAELQHRTNQLQKLALELSQAEERERRRVAVILHEDLQQQMAGARFQLNRLQGRTKDDRQRAEVDRVDEMLKGAIEKSRSLSRDLSPTVLHMNDLGEALRWLVSRVQTQHGLTVHLEVQGEMVLPSEALATFLFRAAQELLFNVATHAGVNKAVVRVRRLGRYVGLCVFDQGRGFDPQDLKETSGFGLLSLRERTELLGGCMKIESAVGRGSRFRIVVPDGRKTEDRTQEIAGVGPCAYPIPSMSDNHAGKEGDHGGPLLRVLVVDDHKMVREGLVSLLQESPAIVVVGQAADGHEAIDMAIELRPNVVIMDVSMPLMAGHEATRQIKTHLPETRVIALSMYDEPDKIEMMCQAGAEGYVLKTACPEELLAAIRGQGAGGGS